MLQDKAKTQGQSKSLGWAYQTNKGSYCSSVKIRQELDTSRVGMKSELIHVGLYPALDPDQW